MKERRGGRTRQKRGHGDDREEERSEAEGRTVRREEKRRGEKKRGKEEKEQRRTEEEKDEEVKRKETRIKVKILFVCQKRKKSICTLHMHTLCRCSPL
jgi:hypothetical protein